MSRLDRPLDNPLNWSLPIGQVWGIRIRIHILFVIFAVVLISMQLPKDGAAHGVSLWRTLLDAVGIYALLFFIVLIHEFGHCFGARFTGGEADEILIWPLGGLASTRPKHDPVAHMITTLAGPMVNVVFCAISSVALAWWVGRIGAVPWNPLSPMTPLDRTLIFTEGQLWLMRFFGLSYLLLLFNLLPIFPLDGGRALQAWLWGRRDYASSMMIATATGMIGAVVLALFGLFVEGATWLLMMIAVFGYITCMRERQAIRAAGEGDAGAFGYDFSQGYTSLERDESRVERGPGFFERRRLAKQAIKAERERERRQRHDEQVELILRKVSTTGLDSLTPQERRILKEETQRQRADDGDARDVRGS